MSSPHRRTSCHSEASRAPASAVVMSLCFFATPRVTGTGMPMNLSPWPYCPSPVLKKRCSTRRFSSLPSADSSAVMSSYEFMLSYVKK